MSDKQPLLPTLLQAIHVSPHEEVEEFVSEEEQKVEAREAEEAEEGMEAYPFVPLSLPYYPSREVWLTMGAPSLQQNEGKWYYEVVVGSHLAAPQIGWATSGFVADTMKGVGDDSSSWGADPQRGQKWHDGGTDCPWGTTLKVNDVIGCAINIQDGEMHFALNGEWNAHASFTFKPAEQYFYPALTTRGLFEITLTAEAFEFTPPDEGYRPLPSGQTNIRRREVELTRGEFDTFQKLMWETSKQVFLFGGLNFAYVVPAYRLAEANSGHTILFCLMVQFIYGAVCQMQILEHLRVNLAQDRRYKHLFNQLSAAKTFCGGYRLSNQLTVIVFVYLSGLVSFIDPTLDATQAGRSESSLSPDEEHLFSKSWIGVPLVGQMIADAGLAKLLTILLCVSVGLQFATFCLLYMRIRCRLAAAAFEEWLDEDETSDQFHAFKLLSELADASSLHLIGHVASVLSNGQDILDVHWVKIILHDLLEGMSSLWFGISLMAYTYHRSDAISICLNLCSILTSFWTSSMGAYKITSRMWSVTMGEFLTSFVFHARNTDGGMTCYERAMSICFITVTFLCLLTVMAIPLAFLILLSASVVRLAGVWFCESHVFNLSTWGCTGLP